MFVAVQLVIFAACVFLFVRMCMAVRRLIRNKVFFFSGGCGALFITLVLAFHLIPLLPFVMISPLPSLTDSISSDPTSCISLLHEVLFFSINSRKEFGGFWKWEDNRTVVSECGFSRLGRVEASELLNGSWVVMAGDSQARLFVDSLLNLVLSFEKMELVKGDLFKRHSDYKIVAPEIGLRLDFIWAPYVTNLTDVMIGLRKNKTAPNVMVLGVGLWDMLHVSSSLDYGVSLGLLRDSLLPVSTELGTYGPVLGSISPHLFWLGRPTLVNTMLNTEEKREKMTSALCDAYEKELFRSKLLCRNGGPLLLLDIRSLSEKCGAQCMMDEMYYGGAVYESSVQIMASKAAIFTEENLRKQKRDQL